MRPNRRNFLKSTMAAAASAAILSPAVRAQSAGARVVVVGGGFGGAACARMLRKAEPRIAVTLVEQSRIYTASPMSNAVIAGLREPKGQKFGYDKLAAERHQPGAVGRDRDRSAGAQGDARGRPEPRL